MILKIKIYFIIAASFGLIDIEANLSQLNVPMQIEAVNLYESQKLEDYYLFAHKIFDIRFSKDTTKHIFYLPYLTTGNKDLFSGGLASAIGGSMAVVYGVDLTERDLQVAAHEVAHTLGAKHNDDSCNIMNSQPCGTEFNVRSKKQIYRSLRADNIFSKRVFRKLMRGLK